MGVSNQIGKDKLLSNRAVFLDRDGVLNKAIVREGKPYPPANLSELEILPGVTEAINILREAGFILIVVSNQPDVARGTTTKHMVEEINHFLDDKLNIDRFIMCYDDDDQSQFRKPRPGMLLAGAQEFEISITDSFMVGDRWRDIEAGISAGCKTIFIDYGYSEKQPSNHNFKVQSLLEAAHIIITNKRESLNYENY